jgi:putative nucleotidyltransferase with HDIG domain
MLISGSFVPVMLAVAFLGPAPAFLVAVVPELVFWVSDRYRPVALGINFFSSGAPTLLGAWLFTAVALQPDHGAFYLLLGAVAALQLALNVTTVTALSGWLHGTRIATGLRAHTRLLPALAINVVLTVAAAGIYRSVGLGAVVFVLVSIFAFTYMARLVVTARERTRQYAALSWGVLSGLIRTLDHRDARAARHAAAVAAFSRDIAQAVGMSERECELAHTAGLLHDIGRFGLSDRVMERGRTLTEQDWDTIREHPAMGADLLRDLGVYGPVAEIVRSHHERIDGRGYPDGRASDEIPELAKIVAVAEVYDTLTADDTYRTPVSSFEALNELRRVSGTQLEGRYVEALAELLAGRGVEYRHADRADFDEELDVERRIGEAVGAGPQTPTPASADEAARR